MLNETHLVPIPPNHLCHKDRLCSSLRCQSIPARTRCNSWLPALFSRALRQPSQLNLRRLLLFQRLVFLCILL